MNIKTLDTTLLFVTGTLWVVALVFPPILDHSYAIFLLVIFSVGIPHGALDHIIYSETGTTKGKNMTLFYLRYLGLIILVGIFWVLFPVLSFILFLALSAYHFGQSQLYHIAAPTTTKHVLYIAWGTFLLSVMITFNYEQCMSIFSSFEWLGTRSWMSESGWHIIFITSGAALGLGFFWLRFQDHISTKRILFEVTLLITFVLLSINTEVVYTFAIYFGLWHSLRSLVMEYQSLEQAISNYSVSHFLKQILPFSLISIVFLVLTYHLSEVLSLGISPYMIFIVIISTLTVPHLMVMYNLYRAYEVNINMKKT